MKSIHLPQLLVRLASKFDQAGLYHEAEVVDKTLRELVASRLSRYQKRAEMQLTKDWVTYNRTAASIKSLEDLIAELRKYNEDSANSILSR